MDGKLSGGQNIIGSNSRGDINPTEYEAILKRTNVADLQKMCLDNHMKPSYDRSQMISRLLRDYKKKRCSYLSAKADETENVGNAEATNRAISREYRG